jgi:hypothetical protein
VTSPNKARLLKLSIELEKTGKSQAPDYPVLECQLREVVKIVEHRREHDLLILRSARLLHTLSAFLKRFPSLHRTEAAQAQPSVDLSTLAPMQRSDSFGSCSPSPATGRPSW